MIRIRRWILPAVAVLFVAAACSGSSDDPTKTSSTVRAPTTSTVAPPAPAPTTSTIDTTLEAERHEDLDYLDHRITTTHPNPFWRSGEDAYLAQLEGIREGAASMTDVEFGLEVMRLVALIDGHSLAMTNAAPINFRRFQIRTYEFDDGLFVLNSHDPAAIGGRVVAVGGQPTEEARAMIEPYVHRDNDMTVRLIAPVYLTYVELLEELGILTDDVPAYTVEAADGSILKLDPPRISSADMIEWLGGSSAGLQPRGTEAESPSADPLYLSDPDRAFWWAFLEESRTVYIQMNRVLGTASDPDGGPRIGLHSMTAEVGEFIDETTVDRVVLDLRHNPGGDNTTYSSLLGLLSTHPQINEQGRLFVIAGRQTFSAAMNLATEIETETAAIFAGEPTGARPNLYGDTATIHLPNSGITVRISAKYWPFAGPDDTRPWIAPTIDVPLMSTAYFSGTDPVLDAVIDFTG